MFTLSAFADEIDPNPQTQIDVLKACGVGHIELRSILKTNVLDLTDLQIAELKRSFRAIRGEYRFPGCDRLAPVGDGRHRHVILVVDIRLAVRQRAEPLVNNDLHRLRRNRRGRTQQGRVRRPCP